MKIGLYENYKFTNLYGGRSSSTPPGRTETNKLKGLVKERTGGVQPPQPPPRQFALHGASTLSLHLCLP